MRLILNLFQLYGNCWEQNLLLTESNAEKQLFRLMVETGMLATLKIILSSSALIFSRDYRD